VRTINMQDMRYLNLFNKITRVSTRFCFKYNEAIVFCVPRRFVSQAVGEGGQNIKKMSEILRKELRLFRIRGEFKMLRNLLKRLLIL